MQYLANKDRYIGMNYNKCGESGLKLPPISLGLWHNFGNYDNKENMRDMLKLAFDNGITHFDLANNYGPPAGSAEENFGHIMEKDLRPYRDELIISSKAGYDMWEGPYGNFGSKKYLISSLEQSLKRMKLDYVDIFYHHRPDPETPLEESMDALATIVRQGKALYVGISNYGAEDTIKAANMLRQLGSRCLINQHRYSMLDRKMEGETLDAIEQSKMGCIVFSPLQKGLLTDRYLNGIPTDSRAAGISTALKPTDITEELLTKINKLNKLADSRGQKMSQLAISWVLRDKRVTSALIGASKPHQILDALNALKSSELTIEELKEIDNILQISSN